MAEQTNFTDDEMQGTKFPQLSSIGAAVSSTNSTGYLLKFENTLDAETCASLIVTLAGLVSDGVSMNMKPGSDTVGIILPGEDSDYTTLKALQRHFQPTVALTGVCTIAAARNTYEVGIAILGWGEADQQTAAFTGFEDRLRALPGYHAHSAEPTGFIVTFDGKCPEQYELTSQLEEALGVRLYLLRPSGLLSFLLG